MEDVIKKYVKITIFCLIAIICAAFGLRNEMSSIAPTQTESEFEIMQEIAEARKKSDTQRALENGSATTVFEQNEQQAENNDAKKQEHVTEQVFVD